MARRLPSLNALRAFEAAARHLSFTRAAEELHVTQAAVSHQIKGLEEQLGLPLFRRLNRRLLLTDAGQAYLPALSEAFDRIAAATDRLSAGRGGGALKISTLPSTAAKWLLPRLSRFRDRHPDIDILVSAAHALVDFRRDDVDLAIRYGRGVYPGLECLPLMPDEIFPVCSPGLLANGPPLKGPEDLSRHTLLHDQTTEGEVQNWRNWFDMVGVRSVDPGRGPGFSDSNLVLEAAAAGQGVALGRRSLALADLASGRLVIPFGPIVPSQNKYYIVYPPTKAAQPSLAAFRDWLLEEAARDAAGASLPTPLSETAES